MVDLVHKHEKWFELPVVIPVGRFMLKCRKLKPFYSLPMTRYVTEMTRKNVFKCVRVCHLMSTGTNG